MEKLIYREVICVERNDNCIKNIKCPHGIKKHKKTGSCDLPCTNKNDKRVKCG
jgi:hypothetical protein